MLRVGLTGGIGSGKSTVAGIFREYGITVLEADAIARAMMAPGHVIYDRIAEHFGPAVVLPDRSLNRPQLAELAFRQGRLAELNRIIHPPVIAEQERRMADIFSREPDSVVIVESALIFEADYSGTTAGIAGSQSGAFQAPLRWRDRFDRIILVTAPDEVKIQRFLQRILPADATPEQRVAADCDARSRLAAQLPDGIKIPLCDAVIDNSGDLEHTREQVARIAAELNAAVGR